MSASPWFYSNAQRQQLGPVTFEKIQQLVASGEIKDHTLVWNEGMPSWVPAKEVPDLFSFQNPPHPPVQPPSIEQGNSPQDHDYPITPVKRCHFTLYLALFIIGFAILHFGVNSLVNSSIDSTKELMELPPIETLEDAEEFREIQAEQLELLSESLNPAALGIIGLGLIFWVSASVLGLIYLYRAWALLQPGHPRTTAGKAVGLLFIPLFNFYWFFVCYAGWSKDWNRIRSSHANLAHLPSSSNALFLAGPICLVASLIPEFSTFATPVVFIIFLMITHKMCQIVNALADLRDAQPLNPPISPA